MTLKSFLRPGRRCSHLLGIFDRLDRQRPTRTRSAKRAAQTVRAVERTHATKQNLKQTIERLLGSGPACKPCLRSRRTRAGKPRGNRSCQGGGRGTNAFRSGVLRPTSNPRQCRCTRSGTNPLERAHLVQPQTANRIPIITCCGAGWSATGCGFYHQLAAGTRQRLGYWPGIWHRRWAQHATCSPETRSVSKDGQRGG